MHGNAILVLPTREVVPLTLELRQQIDVAQVQREWAALLERHEAERGQFIRNLRDKGATQEEIAEWLDLPQQHVSRLLDYSSTTEKLTPAGVNLPTEWELRPYIEAAADEVAEERGVERVRSGRDEVYERAADNFINHNVPQQHNSGNNEWYTPLQYVEPARRAMGGIDLDPASTPEANQVINATTIFTKEDDGLNQEWFGTVWLNPPYASGKIEKFADKLDESLGTGAVKQAVVLVNNATETEWFNVLADRAAAAFFPRRRIPFYSPTKTTTAPLQGQALLYFGNDPDSFLFEYSNNLEGHGWRRYRA